MPSHTPLYLQRTVMPQNLCNQPASLKAFPSLDTLLNISDNRHWTSLFGPANKPREVTERSCQWATTDCRRVVKLPCSTNRQTTPVFESWADFCELVKLIAFLVVGCLQHIYNSSAMTWQKYFYVQIWHKTAQKMKWMCSITMNHRPSIESIRNNAASSFGTTPVRYWSSAISLK